MVKGIAVAGKCDRFAATPLTTAAEEWRVFDQRLPPDHLARRIAQAVAMRDRKPLLDSYLGVGEKALRPDLLLATVLYEMLSKRPSQSGEAVAEAPGWLAKTDAGLREQKQRYAHAAEIMCERQEANAQRRSCKRKPADKVLVSPSDREAALARDKDNVYRPLYTVQLLRRIRLRMLGAGCGTRQEIALPGVFCATPGFVVAVLRSDYLLVF